MPDLRIFKYEVPITDYPEVFVPGFCSLLHIGQQGTKLALWALVDVNHKLVTGVRFRIIGTGHTIDSLDGWKFWKTVQMETGYGNQLVWHVFIEVDRKVE